MDVRDRIEKLVSGNEVVLFMKGTRSAPQCGFSSRVVDLLEEYITDYATVNVLADPEIREGIKDYSSWPTIPQLYVRGTFVGGCDIVTEMGQSGELAELLGAGAAEAAAAPQIRITSAARAALDGFRDPQTPRALRLTVTRAFEHGLDFDEPGERDVQVSVDGVLVVLDRGSARRADGILIDFVETVEGGGFKIENPHAPPRVKPVGSEELQRWLDGEKPMEVFDVRTAAERAGFHIEGSRLLDEAGKAYLEQLDRDATLVFYCSAGMRSQAAAQHAIGMGFREVYNLEGGLSTWRG
jgi:monothiol glutaredoxin